MALSEIGAIVDVVPAEEYSATLAREHWGSIADPSPFSFTVERLYFEDKELHGVSGVVLPGHDRFSGLTCFALKRLVSDWEVDNEARALIKVGIGTLVRDKAWRFNAPDGTAIVDTEGNRAYPSYCTLASLCVHLEGTSEQGAE